MRSCAEEESLKREMKALGMDLLASYCAICQSINYLAEHALPGCRSHDYGAAYKHTLRDLNATTSPKRSSTRRTSRRSGKERGVGKSLRCTAAAVTTALDFPIAGRRIIAPVNN